MATLEQLRKRSDILFTELLKVQATARPRRHDATRAAVPKARAREFSWFDIADAVAAAALSFRLAALAASGATVEEGLSAALDHAEEERGRTRPEEVQIGLALFVTHNHDGRRLAKPRTVAAAPELFSPPRASGPAPAISIGGLSPGLDYWREDVLANEHHQHWHEVYPFTGLPPRSFSEWLTDHTTDDLVEMLEMLDTSQPWRDIVPTLTPAQLAELFSQVLRPSVAPALPRELYTKLFRLNHRQGELFFYMHEQMLARYDAELLSNGLARVEPFGPDDWDDPIAAGHDPIEIKGFGRREPDEVLPPQAGTTLHSLWDEIDGALKAKRLRALGGDTVPIDRTNLGEAVEATVPQLRALAEDAYRGLHNSCHVFIASLAAPAQGVMTSPVAAIRDPVFWQWHKAIDDLNARWQEQLDPYPFDDPPAVLVRNTLGPNADTPWASPDIILCWTSDLPAGTDPTEFGTQLFGGASWGMDFTSTQGSVSGTSLQTIDELTTTMATVNFGGGLRRFLTHEPFSYFLRIENTTPNPLGAPYGPSLCRPTRLPTDGRGWRWTSS
jgi:hypothetical protein